MDCKHHCFPEILRITRLLFISLYSIIKEKSDTLLKKIHSSLGNKCHPIYEDQIFDDKIYHKYCLKNEEGLMKD